MTDKAFRRTLHHSPFESYEILDGYEARSRNHSDVFAP